MRKNEEISALTEAVWSAMDAGVTGEEISALVAELIAGRAKATRYVTVRSQIREDSMQARLNGAELKPALAELRIALAALDTPGVDPDAVYALWEDGAFASQR